MSGDDGDGILGIIITCLDPKRKMRLIGEPRGDAMTGSSTCSGYYYIDIEY